jgi:Beta-1,3-glucanase
MRNIFRRQAIMLGTAAMAMIGLASFARAADGVNNIGRALIPFTIVDNSGSTEPVYLYMFGNTMPVGDGPKFHTYYLSHFNGDCTLFPVSTPNKVYGLKLTGKTVNAFFPQLDAVRVYISVGKQLSVDTNEFGIPDPAPSADVASNPNYNTLWDFVEATWHNYQTHTVLHVNTTQVDAFGLALKVQHSGFNPANPTSPLTIVNGFDTNTARADIFKALATAGSPWSTLVVSNAGTPLRALMPLKSLDLGVFPKNQLDTYINQVVAFYDSAKSNRLIFLYSGVNYTGLTTGGAFVFTPDKAKGDNGVATSTYTIKAPTTRNCYAQDIIPSPNDGPGGAIAAALGASFLRSTLTFYPNAGFPVPQVDRTFYYKNQPFCKYAEIIHEHGINSHAFCYGYDEVAGDSGGNRDVFNPTSFTLTINGL